MTLPILPGASEVRVGLQLSRCVGELQAKDLSVLRVKGHPLYRIVRWLVVGSWALLAIVVFGPGVLDTCAGRRRRGKGVGGNNLVAGFK